MAGSIIDGLPPVSAMLPWLAGPWVLRRAVDNGASMIGAATFIDCGDGRFDYAEHGVLTLADGHRLDAMRRYRFEPSGDGFNVWFAGCPALLFHRVAVRPAGSKLVGNARHLCGDDLYESRYELRADGSFSVCHAVAGPRKRYAIDTDYTRDRK